MKKVNFIGIPGQNEKDKETEVILKKKWVKSSQTCWEKWRPISKTSKEFQIK